MFAKVEVEWWESRGLRPPGCRPMRALAGERRGAGGVRARVTARRRPAGRPDGKWRSWPDLVAEREGEYDAGAEREGEYDAGAEREGEYDAGAEREGESDAGAEQQAVEGGGGGHGRRGAAGVVGEAGVIEPPGLAGAVALVEAGIAALARVEVDGEADGAVLDAVVGLQRALDRLTGQQLRVLDVVERREAYAFEGAVTASSWLRGRTRLDHSQAQRKVQAARRLGRLSGLRGALEAGEVTFAHVAAVTDAAVPRRIEAIAQVESTLVELARCGTPRDVRRAVQAVRDCVDPDGTGAAPLDERGLDERRRLDYHPTIDGMLEVRGLLDQLQGERFVTLIEASDEPDPAGTSEGERRSAGQRRADALDAVVSRVLDAGEAPVVRGHKPHVVATVDLATLAGADAQAQRTPRLRHTGPIAPERVRRLAREAKLTAVLTLGPWRAVSVGRTQRVLPAWLRLPLEVLHRHCRGPGCDRKATWSEAHHVVPWVEGGETDLNRSLPLCPAHHDLVTTGGWRVAVDDRDGVCTWHGPHGQVVTVDPPDP